MDLTFAYHVLPPTFDWLAAYARIFNTVSEFTGSEGVPPNAELAELQVALPTGQTCVRSIFTPPRGVAAPILFPPRAGLLKYVSKAVASICALRMAFIEAPDAFAAFMRLNT